MFAYFSRANRRQRAFAAYYASAAYKAWERRVEGQWAAYDRNNARTRQYSSAPTRMPREIPPPPLPRICRD